MVQERVKNPSTLEREKPGLTKLVRLNRLAEIKDGEDRDAAGVVFDQPLDPDQLPRHLSEREAFIAADSYEVSDLETNTAALNAPPRRVCLRRA